MVVWQDAVADGWGWGIFARRLDPTGVPLGDVFQVNAMSQGSQFNPRVAADANGNFVIVWEDWSTGDANIMAKLYDANGTPVGGEVVVNSILPGDQIRPSVAMTPAGDQVHITFDGPANGTDAWARKYVTYVPPTVYCTAKQNALGCVPTIGWSGQPELTGPDDDFHVTATQVLNQKTGLMFYGLTGPAALPFLGGTLCVQPPLRRLPPLVSGGSGPPTNDCTGAYDFYFSQATLAAELLTAGAIVHAQFWSRDPNDANGVGLTDALTFEIRP